MPMNRALFGALFATCLAACSSAGTGPDASVAPSQGSSAGDAAPPSSIEGIGVLPGPSPTIGSVGGIGVLPGPLPTESPQAIASTSTLPAPDSAVGAIAGGNRVIMLGDSILASTSKRYSNDMCRALVPLGWRVEIDAEVSRGVDFGQQVLTARMDAGWDAGLILLGNNYGGDANDFFKRYNDLIARFGDRPVVVLTVSEINNEHAQVNGIIKALAEAHPNVIVIDWASISTYGGVKGTDGLHLTELGRKVLAEAVAPIFGVAPAQPGECLDTKYRDDSAGSVNGGTSSGGTSSGGTTPSVTTAKPNTKPTGSSSPATSSPSSSNPSSSSPGSSSPGTSNPDASSPGTTNAPVTNPPGTNPPVTNPPATSPPATNPPATSPPVTSLPVTNPPVPQP